MFLSLGVTSPPFSRFSLGFIWLVLDGLFVSFLHDELQFKCACAFSRWKSLPVAFTWKVRQTWSLILNPPGLTYIYNGRHPLHTLHFDREICVVDFHREIDAFM